MMAHKRVAKFVYRLGNENRGDKKWQVLKRKKLGDSWQFNKELVDMCQHCHRRQQHVHHRNDDKHGVKKEPSQRMAPI